MSRATKNKDRHVRVRRRLDIIFSDVDDDVFYKRYLDSGRVVVEGYDDLAEYLDHKRRYNYLCISYYTRWQNNDRNNTTTKPFSVIFSTRFQCHAIAMPHKLVNIITRYYT